MHSMLCLFAELRQLQRWSGMHTLYDWVLHRHWIMCRLYARMYFLLICQYLLILQCRYNTIKRKMHLQFRQLYWSGWYQLRYMSINMCNLFKCDHLLNLRIYKISFSLTLVLKLPFNLLNLLWPFIDWVFNMLSSTKSPVWCLDIKV